MDNNDILNRFNRGFKCAFQRFPLWVAALSLLASAFCYQLATVPYAFLRSQWDFYSFQSIAIGLAAFWIFLGMALICRYCQAISQYQRPEPKKILASLPHLVKEALKVCLACVAIAFVMWLALSFKHLVLQIPHIGTFISILFAWLPFALLLLLKLSPLLIGALLYLLVPLISTQNMAIYRALAHVAALFSRQPVQTILCVLSGTIPLVLAAWLVSSLQKHTMTYLGYDDAAWVISMRRLVLVFASTFVMVPAVSLLSSWGFESTQWLQRQPENLNDQKRDSHR